MTRHHESLGHLVEDAGIDTYAVDTHDHRGMSAEETAMHFVSDDELGADEFLDYVEETLDAE